MNNTNTENTQQNTQEVSQPLLEMSALIADLQHQASALKDLKAKKGPASPEAKDRVKYNALRHGFTGQVLIMTPEEHQKFAAFVKGMMTDLAPVGTHETFLANSMAEEAWRLSQIRARCTNLSAIGDFDGAGKKYRPTEGPNSSDAARIETAVTDTAVARDLSKEFALMSLYGQRTQRAYEKHKKALNELQEKRKADQAEQLEEARLLFQLADSQGLAYDPKEDGFVFSLQFIKVHAERHHKPHSREKNRARLPEEEQSERNHPGSRKSCLICQVKQAFSPAISTMTTPPEPRVRPNPTTPLT